MNRRQPLGIWVTNHLANPLLRPLLHGPAGHRLGRHLALIRYRGRRTGRSYELPVQYARDGDRVWILPGAPGRKTWWRNLRGGAAVDLVLAGHDRHGHATVIAPSQPRFAEGLTAYLRAHPRHAAPSAWPGTAHQATATPGRGRSATARCWFASTSTLKAPNS